MPIHTCTGGTLQCTLGLSPSTFVATPKQVLTSSMPAGHIADHVSLVNILPFGMCTSLANPTVAAATSAAMGVLTPMPCVPATPAPWVLGAVTVVVANQPALDDISTLACTWGGVITFTDPGETTEVIP